MDTGPTRFDPPEAVVPPALAELLLRLNRARLSPHPNPSLPREERLLFDHGVVQRRRVLEHTLCLVFGQWLLYRQLVASSLSSRSLRLLYFGVSVTASSAFVRRRASLVTHDLFAHAVTADADSPLANEARIILAEMEGPDGPYFRTVCRERGFDPTQQVATVPPDSHEDGDIHPQLRLSPRLLSPDLVAVQPLAVPPQTPKRLPGVVRRQHSLDSESDQLPPFATRNPLSASHRRRVDAHAASAGWGQSVDGAADVGRQRAHDANGDVNGDGDGDSDGVGDGVGNGDAEMVWGRPFDFRAAGRPPVHDGSNGSGGSDGLQFLHGDTADARRSSQQRSIADGGAADGGDNDDDARLSPAQMRAAQRRGRRERAMAKAREKRDRFSVSAVPSQPQDGGFQ